MPLRSTPQAAGAVALAALISALLVSCSSDAEPSGANEDDLVDATRMTDVAEDEVASVAEIVEAGSAIDADRSGDGSLAVVYRVVGEVGEVKQSAWRVYDAEGETITEGKGGRAGENSLEGGVLGLDDGFLLSAGNHNLLVGSDGSRAEVKRAGKRLPVKRGDLVYRGLGGSMFRQQPPMIFIPGPRNPEKGEQQGWTVDRSGTRWVQTFEPDEVYRVADDGTWERILRVDLEAGEYLLPNGITALGEFLAAPVARQLPGEGIQLSTIAVRRINGEASGPWRYLDTGPYAEDEWSLFPVVFSPDGQHLVVNDWERRAHRLDIETGEWTEIPPPTEEQFWEIEPGRDGLYAFHSAHADARFSDDWGESWERLPH